MKNRMVSPREAVIMFSLAIAIIGLWSYHAAKPEQEQKLDDSEKHFGIRPEIIKSSSGGIAMVPPVELYLHQHLKDPDSLQIMGYGDLISFDDKDGPCWTIFVRYRAKNSFGGYVVSDGEAFFRNGQVAKWIDHQR